MPNNLIRLIFILAFSIGAAQTDTTKNNLLQNKKDWIVASYDSSNAAYRDSIQSFINMAQSKGESKFAIQGYEYYSLTAKTPQVELSYLDSSYQLSKKIKNIKYQSHYLLKIAQAHFANHDYQNTLLYATKVQNMPTSKMDFNKYASKFLVALMQFKIEDYNNSLDGYHSIKKFFKQESKEYYINVLFGIAEDHLALNNLDSASHYIKLGHKDPIGDYSDYSYCFTYAQGVLDFKQNNYKQAIDSLIYSNEKFKQDNDPANMAQSNFYSGLANEAINQQEIAIEHFKTVDTLFWNNNLRLPLYRTTWLKLIAHYDKENEKDKQLFYQDRLRKFDSLNFGDYKFISNNINDKIQIPSIIQNKNQEIQQQKTGKLKLTLIFAFLILGLVGIVIWIKQIQKRKQRSYEEIVKRLENSKPTKTPRPKSNVLSEELTNAIENKFTEFEENLEFLKKRTTLRKLAQQWGKGYNSRYLSSYINNATGADFSKYLNQLRVNHILKSFKQNTNQMRNWKTDAVADYLGYGSREYYIKGFKQITKMTPSDYLKRLNQDF